MLFVREIAGPRSPPPAARAQRYRFGASVANILAGNPSSVPPGTGWADVQMLNGPPAPGVPAGAWDWLAGSLVPALYAYGPGVIGPQVRVFVCARVRTCARVCLCHLYILDL